MRLSSTWLAFVPLIGAAQSATVTYSSFLGGREYDEVRAVARGPDGSIYLAGRTSSRDFPVRNAWQSSCALGSLGGCTDGFLARFSADGRDLIFSTYYGTNGNDQVRALAVDNEGNAVIAGNLNDVQFAFVARFAPNGQRIGEARVQGSPIVQAHAVAIHPGGDIYLTGETAGLSPPMPAGGYQSTVGPVSCQAIGGSFPLRAYVLRYTSSLSLIGGSYFGGSGNSSARAVAIGPDGNVWLAGDTSSTDLPLVSAFQSDYRGGHSTTPGDCSGGDAFFARFSQDLSTLSFSSYYGGPGRDIAYAAAASPDGVPVFAGSTTAPGFLGVNFKTRQDLGLGGTSDGFLVKLRPGNLTVSLSIYYGGSGADAIYAARIDGRGDVYLAGSSSSFDLPLAQPIQPRQGGCPPPQPSCADAFVARWNESVGIDFATLFGGAGDDGAMAMDLTSQGSILAGGFTAASDFPTVNAFQPAQGSSLTYDGVFFQIAPPQPTTLRVVTAASDSITAVASGSLAAVIGSDLVQSVSVSPFYGFDFTPEGNSIEIRVPGEPPLKAPILFASPSRIIFLVPIPPTTPPGAYSLQLLNAGAVRHSGILTLANPSPAFFSVSGAAGDLPAGFAVGLGGGGNSPVEPTYVCGSPPDSCVASPITASSEGNPRALQIYGTGFTSGAVPFSAVIGTIDVQVLSVRRTTTPGIDEIILSLPSALNGQNRVLPVMLFMPNGSANMVRVRFK